MKTEREIRDKINELMDQASECQDKELKESICTKIDALLWVIGDCSGLPI